MTKLLQPKNNLCALRLNQSHCSNYSMLLERNRILLNEKEAVFHRLLTERNNSGKLNLRMPPDLDVKGVTFAGQEGLSNNSYILLECFGITSVLIKGINF